MSVFAQRLKEARLEAGMSQEGLGVKAGIDEASASARMNQYERGKHLPDVLMIERIAEVLNVPEAYFSAKDDDLAWLLIQFHRMGVTNRKAVISYVKNIV